MVILVVIVPIILVVVVVVVRTVAPIIGTGQENQQYARTGCDMPHVFAAVATVEVNITVSSSSPFIYH